MRKSLLRIICCLFIALEGNAQSYENTWFFGSGLAVNFTNGAIESGGIPNPPTILSYENNSSPAKVSIAVSKSSDLQFFSQIGASGGGGTYTYDYTNYAVKVFDKLGYPFPNGNIHANLNTSGSTHSGGPVVVPYPGKPDHYFLFYVHNNALLYSVIDMTLNGGMGDVDINHKDVILTGYNSIIGYKMAAVQGCDGVWLVIRSRTANEYLSFKIDEQGVNPKPVISECGNYPNANYTIAAGIPGGLLRVSNNGKYLVAATNKGIEMYDFEKCSGKLKNARWIDSMQSYGLCFSPDDSKLYASHQINYNGHAQGEVYQYDLNQPNLQSIAASKTIVMRNHLYYTLGLFYPSLDTGPFGDLKLGMDGKIYVGNSNTKTYSSAPCSIIYPPGHEPIPVPPSSNCLFNQRLYVIHDPDQPGTTCNAELDYLELPGTNNKVTGKFLQNDIVAAPTSLPDTISGTVSDIKICFKNSATLSANEEGSCHVWDDGSTERTRAVQHSGTYWVSYFQDCTFRTDTFHVLFIPLPEINNTSVVKTKSSSP